MWSCICHYAAESDQTAPDGDEPEAPLTLWPGQAVTSGFTNVSSVSRCGRNSSRKAARASCRSCWVASSGLCSKARHAGVGGVQGCCQFPVVLLEVLDERGHVGPDRDERGKGHGVLREMVMVKDSRGLKRGRLQPLGGVDHTGGRQPERLVNRLQHPRVCLRVALVSRGNRHPNCPFC
jgi:hypothetical protein